MGPADGPRRPPGRRPDRENQAPAIFVVGMPRSGTTLLRLMLDAHPELAIPAETHFLPDLVELWERLEAGDAPPAERARSAFELITCHPRWLELDIDADALRAHLEACAPMGLADALRATGLVYAASRQKPRWGDKTPGYVVKMPLLQQAVPEARFVHVIRDGRDVALSLRPLSWGPGELDEIARRWSRRIKIARRDAERLAPGSYTEVRYEDLVTRTERVLRELCDFLELPFAPSMLEHHRDAAERMAPALRDLNAGAARTISAAERRLQHSAAVTATRTDRVGRWRREMPPSDRREFESIAGPTLAELGYELEP